MSFFGGIFIVFVIFLIILFACKLWRFSSWFRSSRFSSPTSEEEYELQTLILSDGKNLTQGPNSEVTREYDLESARYQNEGLLHSLIKGRVYKQRPSFSYPRISLAGLTLKTPAEKGTLAEVQTYDLQDNRNQNLQHDLENDRHTDLSPRLIKDQRNWLCLEVIAGPSKGLQLAVDLTSTFKLPVKLGRISPADLVVNDETVSGRHAQITWNSTKLNWELVDMGSLNGTLLNSQLVSHPDSGSRKQGHPVELASEDIITLGLTTKVYVRISSQNEFEIPIPFKIGVTSDPMALWPGGKAHQMEDVVHYKWPLPVADKFGLFCICDGHGGAKAAKAAIEIIPKVLEEILSDSLRKEKVLSEGNASDVLRDVIAKTEAGMEDHEDEGCTATVLLVWKDPEGNFIAQCANVGDSACVVHLDGRYIEMTEDHRMTSWTERKRLQEAGLQLEEGKTRFLGVINIARALGDKFIKQQDSRFIAEPYISEPLCISQSSKDAFVILASDGLWDKVSSKKAVEFVLQMREKEAGTEDFGEKIAKGLLEEARKKRTKDNTTILIGASIVLVTALWICKLCWPWGWGLRLVLFCSLVVVAMWLDLLGLVGDIASFGS